MPKQTTTFNKTLFSIIILLGLFTLLITNISAAKAQGEQRFVMQPADTKSSATKNGYFVLTGQTGQTIENSIKVTNPGTTPIELVVYPVDGLTTQGSGESYTGINQTTKDVASWINLKQTEVQVEPGKDAIVSFSMTIPQNARAGQHLGGIAAQAKNNDDTSSQTGSFGVKILPRTVTPIKINVGGAADVLSLKIIGVQISTTNSQSALTLNLLNDGTGFIKPKGQVTLTDASGKSVLANKLSLDNILPQDTISYPVTDKLPEPGTYKVHASLDFGGSAPAVYDGQVEVKAQPAKAAAAAPTSQASANQPAAANTNANANASSNTGNAASNPAATVAAIQATSAQVAPASSDNGMLIGIVIGVAVMLGLTTLGLGGYIVATRGKKGNQ